MSNISNFDFVVWSKFWKDKKKYVSNYDCEKKYCIAIPPPNITGRLHMGHAFQCTIMDLLIRYYKMKGFSILWKFGTDHAGIATQILFEQKFKNVSSFNFFKKANKWKKIAIYNIKKQLSDLGFLINFDTSRFTLDKHFSYAVYTAFIKLFEDKLIYKEFKLVNWDIKLKTAISDLEVIYKNIDSKLYYLKYRVLGSEDYLSVATTRPETIFADVAIAVNPNDIRYNMFIGKNVIVPIVNKIIPVISDVNVDITFGSGCLKITPGHDFKDFDIAKRHKLFVINILTSEGFLNDNVLESYRGMSILKAREKIASELLALSFIYKIENIKNRVPFGDRSDSIIEPFLTNQWYLRTELLKNPVINFINDGKIKIIPNKWTGCFLDWLHKMTDWCISRQIWWGHRLPVWYDDKKNIYVGYNIKYVLKKYRLKDNFYLYQETDVLDTWFSSALWPFASLGWPCKKIEFCKFYPTNIVVTGFDIIFFWVIRMLMFGLNFTKMLPFKEIYVHGLIKDNDGKKMSKTKGNVLDPLDIVYGISKDNLVKKQLSGILNSKLHNKVVENINKNYPNGIDSYGVDPLRLMLISLSTHKLFIKIDIKKVYKYKIFCNKIFNAYNFLKENNINVVNIFSNYFYFSLYDSYIFYLWEKTKKYISQNILKKNFSKSLFYIYKFFWHEFCDWYIEIIKKLKKHNEKFVGNIFFIFKEFVLIFHPFAPFLTEKIWSLLKIDNSSVLDNFYPKFFSVRYDFFLLFVKLFKKCVYIVRKYSYNLFYYDNFLYFFVADYKSFYLIENNISLIKGFLNIFFINFSFIFYDKCVKVMNNVFLLVYNVKVIPFADFKKKKILHEIENIEIILNNKIFLQKADKNIILYKKEKLDKLKSELYELELFS